MYSLQYGCQFFEYGWENVEQSFKYLMWPVQKSCVPICSIFYNFSMLHKLTHITLPHGAITCHFSVSWHITHYNENEFFLMTNSHQISAQIQVFLPFHGIFQVIFKVSSFGASLSGSLFFLFHFIQL